MLRILFIALFAVCVLQGAASAQRGGGFVERESAAETTELLRFPGFMDTHTLRAGEIVGDMPFFNVEYGITRDLSVGSNLLVDVASLSGSPSVHGQMRYRFYQKGRFKTVFDLMLVGNKTQIPEDDEGNVAQSLSIGMGILGANTSLRLDRASQVTAGLKVGRVLVSSIEDDAPEGFVNESTVALVSFSLAYERRVTRWLHLQAAGLILPVINGALDSSVASASVDLGSSVPIGSRTLLRAMLNMSTSNWLFSVGALASANARFTSPWLGIARKWK